MTGYSENSSDPLGLLRKEHENENISHIKVCCWHTTKENCKLASDIINRFHQQDPLLLPYERVKIFGDMMIQIILSTKHRGTLECAFASFEKVCCYLLKSTNQNFYNLPRLWLEEFLDFLDSIQTKKTNLVITRRRYF